MTDEVDAKNELREWIARKNGDLAAAQISDDLLLLEMGILSSIQVVEMLRFIEELRGRPIDIETLQLGTFRNLNAIVDAFFPDQT